MLIEISTYKILEIRNIVQEKINQQPPDKITLFNLIMDDLNECLREKEVCR